MWPLTLLTVFFNYSVYASFQVRAQIYDIDQGQQGEEILIFLSSGHVVRVSDNEKEIHDDMNILHKSQQWTSFVISEKNKIESYTKSPSRLSLKPITQKRQIQEEDYIPTIIENMDLAEKHFKELRYVAKESQCYNRAHIWSYEWFINGSINSNKTWIFFTRRYIRKFKFEWWFHVSPSVSVIDEGIIKEKIMDAKYARGPLDLKRWTDIFMKDDANCPMVKTYSDYANYPESGSCYTMRTSMFYYQPIDMETKETWGTVKANWYDTEVKQAYLEAFDEVI
jgi:hypothetical protein